MKKSESNNLLDPLISSSFINVYKRMIICVIMIVLIIIIPPSFFPINKQNKSFALCDCISRAYAKDTATIKTSNDIELIDVYGKKVDFKKIPKRVVSLVPGITEMIMSICPEYRLKGVVYYDAEFPAAEGAVIVGGFFNPDTQKIRLLNPDIIFASSLHKPVIEEFKKSNCNVVILEAKSFDDVFRNIEIVGRIFNSIRNANGKIEDIRSQIGLIQKKLGLIPAKKRLRVMRLMGRDNVMTPGSDSFQTEAIKLAGGIPVPLGRKGSVVKVSLKEWKSFNPQIVYGCGGDKKVWNKLSKKLGWKDVDAVKNGRYLSFPCELTCRASTHFGYFIAWLSASIYGEYFFSSQPVQKNHIIKRKVINLDLSYIQSAFIKYGITDDFTHKTLVVRLKSPVDVLSTLEGFRNVSFVGNHYISPPLWGQGHNLGIKGMRKKICTLVNVNPESAAFLITGADMDHLAVVKKLYKKYKVYALVTAGVRSNAQRQSKDEGLYYPAGTINIIILTNRRLTDRAMSRAIITATEAKSAALQDLDIRSSYTPQENAATGTGTDNVLIIGGCGNKLDSTGGHTKMGELIARACYDGVTEAIYKQNRIAKGRTIFARLKDRNISLFEIARIVVKHSATPILVTKIVEKMEKALMKTEVKEFMEICLAVSDAYNRGLINDISYINQLGLNMAEFIAGSGVDKLMELQGLQASSIPLRIALSALATGAVKGINNKE